MRSIFTCMVMVLCFAAVAQVTAVSPNQAYQGQSLSTTITSASLFLTGSSPQGNIENIILKNATDSAFAVSDSTNVVSTSSATTFWNLPANLATGLYSLVVRVYNSLFSGPTTDYSLSNGFTVTAATATVSGTVYDDLNHNGTMDPGEPGLPGYTIYLSPLGNIAVSDSNGRYTVATVPGLDTITIQQPADDIYLPAEPTRYILNVPYGADTGHNFGMVLYRYLSSMSPDSASINQTFTATITSNAVFLNATINNILLRNRANGSLIYGYGMAVSDTNHASVSFSTYSNPNIGLYDLVVVVQSTLNSALRTFVLDSAFTMYGPVGFISGYAFVDSNGNGVKDPNEPGISGQYITLAGTGTTSYYSTVVTNSSGYYSFSTLANGTYNISIYNPANGYYYCGPMSTTYTTASEFADTISRDTIDNVNFGTSIVSGGPQYDLFIHPGWTPANPGFPRHYWIYYGNNNPSVPVTGAVITMQYDPTLTFDSMAGNLYPPSSIDLLTRTITWNVDSVPYSWMGGWTGGFNMYFTVSAADTSGQLLNDFFSITPVANDCDQSNNTVADASPVTSSRDPNSKQSMPYGAIYYGQDSIITYTITFQNTGTAPTHFVTVVDTLNPNLDPRTVVTTGGSASFKFNNNNGILTFTFDPLVLADSATDAAQSVGFVSFMVKVRSGTPIGTVINNTAYVYFDYNAAVITNTATNDVQPALGVRNMRAAMNVSVQPNPFEESTLISFSNAAHEKYTLTIYDATGSEVRTMTGSGTQFILGKDGLASGVYMYKLINLATKQSAQGKISVL